MEWDRRHGGYQTPGIHDMWLWSPNLPGLVLDLPLTGVVLDMAYESLGVIVTTYSGSYRRPSAERYFCLRPAVRVEPVGRRIPGASARDV
ncbi:hypothetical protein OIT41_08675 [Arthrobacter sp. YA7-1]|uniref:hypothetical protein n=1 Tax=Arthrobacter sp. YA7-1 TaxID=2987701 RepID=UPI0022260A3C|nr:hypothetical protein [Arthrobacter sp. YA7-1]UYY83088.1 hypothetical protein OIT41_08675 [Arthrobacter sp. YA7-1]